MTLKLMVSRNLGISYHPELEVEDENDPRLAEAIRKAKDDVLRYYVEGAPEIVCPQHAIAFSLFGSGGFKSTSIEEKAARLQEHFCKGKKKTA